MLLLFVVGVDVRPSPFWIPPEMIRRETHGLAVDVWSFGICTLELANNNIPNR